MRDKTDEGRTGPPRLVLGEVDDPLLSLLQDAQLLLFKYPSAAQAAFRALVAEGRRFATTPEGRAWRDRLAGSELVRRGLTLWAGSSLDMLTEPADGALPSGYLEAIFDALASDDLHGLLLRLAGLPSGDDDADH
jgi:hypothetical protein